MSLLSPIQSLLVLDQLTVQEVYDQPYYRKPSLASQNLLLEQKLSEWVHQIYFDKKKLNELSVLRLVQHPIQAVKPNIACSIMYTIIREKVQQVCKQIRELIILSYRKLMLKKDTNSDLKHSSDSWNVNFSKFRKASLDASMGKVYGPIAHIICTYHNSLLDCNKEVYDLWKLLYQCSETKDLEFKTLQGSLNQLILEELMQEFPDNEMTPKQVMPTLSSFEKHEFIFKEMWGFQKRKLAVQFNPKSQQILDEHKDKTAITANNPNNMPKKVQKGQVLSPPKPISLSQRQVGVNTSKPLAQSSKPQNKPIQQRQQHKKKTIDEQLHYLQLQQQVEGLDNQTRIKILRHLYEYKHEPWFPKQKEQTLRNIEKIIMNNLTETQKQILQNPTHLIEPLGETIEIQLEDDEELQCKQEDDHTVQYYFEENQREAVQDDIIDDYQIKMELDKIRETLEADRGQKSKNKQGNKLEIDQITSENDGQDRRYKQVCERLQLIRDAFKKARLQINTDKDNPSVSANPNILPSSQTQKLPDLIPIDNAGKNEKKANPFLRANQTKPDQKKQSEQQPKPLKSNSKSQQFTLNKNIFNLKIQDQQRENIKKQCLYQKLKRFYEAKALDQLDKSKDECQGKKKKLTDSEMTFMGRNLNLSSLSEMINEKKSISQTFQSFSSNGKAKFSKTSQQEIFDQIYEIAKEKQKRGHHFKKSDIKLTYKKISCELGNGDVKSEIKITKGSFTADDLNWIEEIPKHSKYSLGDTNEFTENLIDQPYEDICQEQKPEKKKKKKKKKKNKAKKELSEENDLNIEKASTQSMKSRNQEEEDLERLQEFKKKSVYDLFNIKKMMGWTENQSLQQYLETSEIIERQKEQELLMQKKIEIYENSSRENQDSGSKRKDLSKENKSLSKRDYYNEDQLKLYQFLENLQIKDQNREKCVVTEETLQKILYKRKLIKTNEIFEKYRQRAETSVSTRKAQKESSSTNRPTDLSNPKTAKPKNKKKKK